MQSSFHPNFNISLSLDTVRHWPAIQKWSNIDYLLEILKDDQSGTIEKLEAKSSVSFNITSSNPLSDDVLLPLILQCEEFVKGGSEILYGQDIDPDSLVI